MKNILYLAVGVIVIFGSFYLFLKKPAPVEYQTEEWKTEEVVLTGSALKIADATIAVELADTPEKRTLGLSGRKSLDPGTGLLFLFDSPAKHGFWMKDMRFAIDIVWISEDWKIVDIDREVTPGTYPEVFSPNLPAKYVLEVPAGTVEQLYIDIGQEVYLIGQN